MIDPAPSIRSIHSVPTDQKTTSRSLREQMRITGAEIAQRKALLDLRESDVEALRGAKDFIAFHISSIVNEFYVGQTAVGEIDLLIGDADTLRRLNAAMRSYVLQLFSGSYDQEYVNSRLRIGLVHKRIGVEPKLYLSAIYSLSTILRRYLREFAEDEAHRERLLAALDKMFSFDTQLVFDTYIRSLTSAVESAKEKVEAYANGLEATVALRTRQLEELSRRDGLTGLYNQRTIMQLVHESILACQRTGESVCLVYLDCDKFKDLNDAEGHQMGDKVIRTLGQTIKRVVNGRGDAARYGGDEFCFILPEATLAQAREYVSELLIELRAESFPLSLSVGIAQTGPIFYVDTDALLRAADQAMYKAKHGGGGKVITRILEDGVTSMGPLRGLGNRASAAALDDLAATS